MLCPPVPTDDSRRSTVAAGWTATRIAAAVLVLGIALLNILRFIGMPHPHYDPLTLLGETALIVIDIALVMSAYLPRTANKRQGVPSMSIVKTVDVADATGEVAKLYEEDLQEIGYVPSHTKMMAMNPAAVRAFEGLMRTIAFPLGKRSYELVTLAAARAIGSQSCLLAHGKKSLGLFPEADLIRIAEDYRDAGLTDAEVAMMDYAAKLSMDSSTMTDADSQRLRDVGFSDADIVNITLAAAARNYYSRALHALAVEVDVPADLSARLTRALVGNLT
ncbi:MAG TPA: peroxidase-related enzyme [Galbitalea sp.]|jgi:uncharacterized peroxidase-related enzyme|nr:peroxidase-related enzyme [Galbitalea sp.]